MGNAVKALTKYSYADYLTWNDDERWEIIDGIPYNMSPAPRRMHQRISKKLVKIIETFLTGKKCEMYNAPYVRFADANEDDVLIDTLVQPDLVVYCDEKKLDDKGGIGAPDFIIEILSPKTAAKDFGVKTLLYQKHGVKEYWIIDPDTRIIYTTMLNKEKRFEAWKENSATAKIKCTVLKGLTIDMKEIFS